MIIDAPQNMWLRPSLRVMCICEGKKDIQTRLLHSGRAGRDHPDLQDDLGTFETKQEEAAKVRLTFALTFASIEGMTLPGTLKIHDGSHPRFDWRKLFVGLSRGTSTNDVEVV